MSEFNSIREKLQNGEFKINNRERQKSSVMFGKYLVKRWRGC
jgi:hypothetical protein